MSIPSTMSTGSHWDPYAFLSNFVQSISLPDPHATQSAVNQYLSTVSPPITAGHTVQWPYQSSSSISQLAHNLLSSSSSPDDSQNESSHSAPLATSSSSPRRKRVSFQLPPDSANNPSDTDEPPQKRRRESSSSSSSTDARASISSQVSTSSVDESFQSVIAEINTLIDPWIDFKKQCEQNNVVSKDQLTQVLESLPQTLTTIQKKRAAVGSTSFDTDWDKKLTSLRDFHKIVVNAFKEYPDTQMFCFSNTPNSSNASSDTQASSSSSIPTSKTKVSKKTKIEELDKKIKECFTIMNAYKGKKGINRKLLEDVMNHLNSINKKNYERISQLDINAVSLDTLSRISDDLGKILEFCQMLNDSLIACPNSQFFNIPK